MTRDEFIKWSENKAKTDERYAIGYRPPVVVEDADSPSVGGNGGRTNWIDAPEVQHTDDSIALGRATNDIGAVAKWKAERIAQINANKALAIETKNKLIESAQARTNAPTKLQQTQLASAGDVAKLEAQLTTVNETGPNIERGLGGTLTKFDDSTKEPEVVSLGTEFLGADKSKDVYGRTIVNNEEYAKYMVEKGFAVPAFNASDEIVALGQKAKAEGTGLWNKSNPQYRAEMESKADLRGSFNDFQKPEDSVWNALQGTAAQANKLGADLLAIPTTISGSFTEEGRKKGSFSQQMNNLLTGEGTDSAIDYFWGYDNRADKKFQQKLSKDFDNISDAGSMLEFVSNLPTLGALSMAMQSMPESVATVMFTPTMVAKNFGNFLRTAEENSDRDLTTIEKAEIAAAALAYTYTDAIVDKYVFLNKGPLKNVLDKALDPAFDVAKKYGIGAVENIAKKLPELPSSAKFLTGATGYIGGKAAGVVGAGSRAMVVEGSTEGLQAVPQYLAENIQTVNEGKLNEDELWKTVKENAAAGAISGPVMKGMYGTGQFVSDVKGDLDRYKDNSIKSRIKYQKDRVEEINKYVFSPNKNVYDAPTDNYTSEQGAADTIFTVDNYSAAKLTKQAISEFKGTGESIEDIDGNKYNLKDATANLVNTIKNTIVKAPQATAEELKDMTPEQIEAKALFDKVSEENSRNMAKKTIGNVATKSINDAYKIGAKSKASSADKSKVVDSLIYAFKDHLDKDQMSDIMNIKAEELIKEFSLLSIPKTDKLVEDLNDVGGNVTDPKVEKYLQSDEYREVQFRLDDLAELVKNLKAQGSFDFNGEQVESEEIGEMAKVLEEYVNRARSEGMVDDKGNVSLSLNEFKSVADVSKEITSYGFIDKIFNPGKLSINQHIKEIESTILSGQNVGRDKNGAFKNIALEKLNKFQSERLRGKNERGDARTGAISDVLTEADFKDQIQEIKEVGRDNQIRRIKLIPKDVFENTIKKRNRAKYMPELDISGSTITSKFEESRLITEKAQEMIDLAEQKIAINPEIKDDMQETISMLEKIIADQNEQVNELSQNDPRANEGEATFFIKHRNEKGQVDGYAVVNTNNSKETTMRSAENAKNAKEQKYYTRKVDTTNGDKENKRDGQRETDSRQESNEDATRATESDKTTESKPDSEVKEEVKAEPKDTKPDIEPERSTAKDDDAKEANPTKSEEIKTEMEKYFKEVFGLFEIGVNEIDSKDKLYANIKELIAFKKKTDPNNKELKKLTMLRDYFDNLITAKLKNKNINEFEKFIIEDISKNIGDVASFVNTMITNSDAIEIALESVAQRGTKATGILRKAIEIIFNAIMKLANIEMSNTVFENTIKNFMLLSKQKRAKIIANEKAKAEAKATDKEYSKYSGESASVIDKIANLYIKKTEAVKVKRDTTAWKNANKDEKEKSVYESTPENPFEKDMSQSEYENTGDTFRRVYNEKIGKAVNVFTAKTDAGKENIAKVMMYLIDTNAPSFEIVDGIEGSISNADIKILEKEFSKLEVEAKAETEVETVAIEPEVSADEEIDNELESIPDDSPLGKIKQQIKELKAKIKAENLNEQIKDIKVEILNLMKANKLGRDINIIVSIDSVSKLANAKIPKEEKLKAFRKELMLGKLLDKRKEQLKELENLNVDKQLEVDKIKTEGKSAKFKEDYNDLRIKQLELDKINKQKNELNKIKKHIQKIQKAKECK